MSGDIYVSASTFELHSLSYLEAMACGLPLVCREDASLRGVLEDGENGLIYRNEQEFVDAVSRILRSGQLREQMCAAALLRAEETGALRFAERTLTLYQSVCTQWASGYSRAGRKGKKQYEQ
ncbi:MAG: glycosyltransferase [Clostridia bacterium]|nr:glycosyltransferase [Clostridia bacterium]